jgi:hypothetical protein
MKLFRSARNRMVILAVLMAIAIAPQFWTYSILSVELRLYWWYLPLIVYWLGRALRPDTRPYRLE